MTKVCRNCHTEQSIDCFHKDAGFKDGHKARCRNCDNGKLREKRKLNPELREKLKAISKEYYHSHKEEMKLHLYEWRKKNPEKAKIIRRRYRLNNYEKVLERTRQSGRDWVRKYPGRLKAKNARARARQLQRTPKWADLKAIQIFYEGCPKGYHVDHIIPLNGKNISGLHVLNNLQYLPAIENLRKGNRFE